jgi:phage tail protein X
MVQRVEVRHLGVMLDRLAFDVLDTDTGGVVEQALDANPGLADRLLRNGHALTLGVVVVLPDLPPQTRTIKQIKLWE